MLYEPVPTVFFYFTLFLCFIFVVRFVLLIWRRQTPPHAVLHQTVTALGGCAASYRELLHFLGIFRKCGLDWIDLGRNACGVCTGVLSKWFKVVCRICFYTW